MGRLKLRSPEVDTQRLGDLVARAKLGSLLEAEELELAKLLEKVTAASLANARHLAQLRGVAAEEPRTRAFRKNKSKRLP